MVIAVSGVLPSVLWELAKTCSIEGQEDEGELSAEETLFPVDKPTVGNKQLSCCCEGLPSPALVPSKTDAQLLFFDTPECAASRPCSLRATLDGGTPMLAKYCLKLKEGRDFAEKAGA